MEWKDTILMDEEEEAYAPDSKFKQFTTAVDKALKSFEYSTEWADLISCLGKLNKVIATYSTFPVIPRKILVGKRLAQCLHPALPSGVHLKALETYSLIFKQIGRSRVSKDLFIYSAGLFPLLAAAAISVKPVLIDIYEEFYVPLGAYLIPALPGFIMAVLPGIEEGSEFNERITSLLEDVCQTSHTQSFFSSLWGCVLYSTQVRLPAVTFALDHLVKRSSDTDKSYIYGNDLNLMVDAICSALEDHNILVQRIMLDFLLAFIPLENTVLQKGDIVCILVCSLSVLLRRDMSLNRRLYQWILGRKDDIILEEESGKSSQISSPEVLEDKADTSHFEKCTKVYVVAAVVTLFKSARKENASSDPVNSEGKRIDALKPFRIFLSLLDRPEVGSTILEDVLLEVFRALYSECACVSTEIGQTNERRCAKEEFVKTANLLFNALESYFIWEFLGRAFSASFQRNEVPNSDVDNQNENITNHLLVQTYSPDCLELFLLTDFLLDIVSVETAIETQTDHWPSLLNCVIDQMTQNVCSMAVNEIYQGILLALKLLSKISPALKSPIMSRKGGSANIVDEGMTLKNEKSNENISDEFDAADFDESGIPTIVLCIQKSKAFFHSFVTNWILPSQSFKAEGLGNQLEEENYTDDVRTEDGNGVNGLSMSASTFAATCKYLVELACFPCWEPFNFQANYDENILSEWLESLIGCISTSNINIQAIAMGTLLDLVNVSLCCLDESTKTDTCTPNVVPVISGTDFYMLDHSQVYKEMALILWNEFRPENCQFHTVCADLFLRLHNLSPCALLCEDVVSTTMVSHILDVKRKAHWKFSVLWHLSRDFYRNESAKSSRGGNRNIDRCMMLMLDSLQSEDPIIGNDAEKWLQHAVHCGDIGRLLEPLLITMLNPCSRRISVHYVSLYDTRIDETETASQDILSDSENDQLLQDVLEEASIECSDVKRQLADSPDSLSPILSENMDEVTAQQSLKDSSEKLNEDSSREVKGATKLSTKFISDKAKTMDVVRTSRSMVHPLHVHKLFYTELYDTTQTIYSLKTVLSILNADGKDFVFSSATMSMSICSTAHQTSLRELLIRHRRALTGKDFYGSLADSHQLLIKASTAKYMEILLSVCLYFIRSEYHPSVKAEESDIEDNFRVRVWSLHVLTKVVRVLLEIVNEGDSAFSNFVSDLFDRCKVQRIALHCLLSSVYNLTTDELSKKDFADKTNFTGRQPSCSGEGSKMHIHFLHLIKKLIFLEERVGYGKKGSSERKTRRLCKGKKQKSQQTSGQFDFIVGLPIVSQPMFLSVLLSALKEFQWSHNHVEWIETVMEILPKTGVALPKIVIPVVDQVFLSLKSTSVYYFKSISGKLQVMKGGFPIDFLLTCLESVTKICHYCVIEKENRSGIVQSSRDIQRAELAPSIFESLVHVFSSQSLPNTIAVPEEVNEPWLETKEGLLSILPAMLSSVLFAWHVWSDTSSRLSRWGMAEESPLPIGQPKSVRQAILQFLTPIAVQHAPVFFAAVADVWNSSKNIPGDIQAEATAKRDEKCTNEEKKWLLAMNSKSRPSTNHMQQSLLDIVLAIKVLSIESIIDTSKNIMRQTCIGKEKHSSGNQSLEVNLLQFLYEYLQKISKDQLVSIKTTLLCFLKDGINLNSSPQTLFAFLNIFYSFVVRIQCPDEKRSRKELQDLALKFFEAMNTIAGASLESSTWFRRNVAVLRDQGEDEGSDQSIGTVTSQAATSIQIRNSKFSASSLSLMAEVLSSMLDLLYKSDEKDRVTSFLFCVMYNVTPYLKNHSVQNSTNFRASSALLASLTDYQYTLRSWKKDVYDLFLESDFFKMDHVSLRFWRYIIDHLMTYDSATFRDLMTRINMSQSGAINIFANREQEIEQRASLLKRLAFIIFCGETDQYHNYMPDVQERLVDSLRQMQAPVLYQQVFFCFRILIQRISPHHLTSLWPHIVTELVTVFLRMEKELLSTDIHQPKNSIMGTIESLFPFNGSTKNKEKWLQLFLEACKLLDLSFSLESDQVPHIQSYRWAFIKTAGVEYDQVERLMSRDGLKEVVLASKDKEKLKISANGNQEKPSTKPVSKLSLMNAPLSSKLRQNERKNAKEKAKLDQKNKPSIRMKFIPYLSRLAMLVSQNDKDQGTENTTLKQEAANDVDKRPSDRTSETSYHEFIGHTLSKYSDLQSPDDGRARRLLQRRPTSKEDVSRTCTNVGQHALELSKIGSIADLLPFLEFISNRREDNEESQSGIVQNLEEITEKDFQEDYIDRSK